MLYSPSTEAKDSPLCRTSEMLQPSSSIRAISHPQEPEALRQINSGRRGNTGLFLLLTSSLSEDGDWVGPFRLPPIPGGFFSRAPFFLLASGGPGFSAGSLPWDSFFFDSSGGEPIKSGCGEPPRSSLRSVPPRSATGCAEDRLGSWGASSGGSEGGFSEPSPVEVTGLISAGTWSDWSLFAGSVDSGGAS